MPWLSPLRIALVSCCSLWALQVAVAVDRRQVMRTEDSAGSLQQQGRLEVEEEHSVVAIGSNGNMKRQKQQPDMAMSQLAESAVPLYQVVPGTAMPVSSMPVRPMAVPVSEPVMKPAPYSPQQQIGGMPAQYSVPQAQPMGSVPMMPQPMPMKAPVPMYQAAPQAPMYQPVPQFPAPQAPAYQMTPQAPVYEVVPQTPVYSAAPQAPFYQPVVQSPQAPMYQAPPLPPQQAPVYSMPQAPFNQAMPQAPVYSMPQAPVYQSTPQQQPQPLPQEAPAPPAVPAQPPFVVHGEVLPPVSPVQPAPALAPATAAPQTQAPPIAPEVAATTTVEQPSPLGIAPVPSAAKEAVKATADADAQGEDDSETPAKRRVIIMVLVASVNIVLAVYFLRKNCEVSAPKSLGNLGLMFSKYRMPAPANVVSTKAGDRAPRTEAPQGGVPAPRMREASDDDLSSRSQSSEEDADQQQRFREGTQGGKDAILR